jgi:hypothetical protein
MKVLPEQKLKNDSNADNYSVCQRSSKLLVEPTSPIPALSLGSFLTCGLFFNQKNY